MLARLKQFLRKRTKATISLFHGTNPETGYQEWRFGTSTSPLVAYSKLLGTDESGWWHLYEMRGGKPRQIGAGAGSTDPASALWLYLGIKDTHKDVVEYVGDIWLVTISRRRGRRLVRTMYGHLMPAEI